VGLIVLLILRTGLVPMIVTGAFALGGTLWYLIYVRTRIKRRSALVHMVEGIVSKEMQRAELDQELLEIALDRDDVSLDRFDRLVQDAPILDIPDAVTASELFARAAEALSPRLSIPEQELLHLFEAREAESSTVLQPGLAIPHVIVEGKNLFDVLMVRCQGGALFPNQDSPVHIAFVLIGSADQRNFHLRALMAISFVVGEPYFFRRWLTAPTSEHLRDIVILSSRQRGED